MNKKQRIQSFDSGSTHAMTLMAVDLDDNGKPKKWMVENSWGKDAGYQGPVSYTHLDVYKRQGCTFPAGLWKAKFLFH